jgi:anti-anti-sigma factor
MSGLLTARGNVLHVDGSIDFRNADACCAEGLDLLAAMPAGPVVVDLAGLATASSVAVAVLLRWARAVAARGQALALARVPEKCRAIVRVSGLADALPEQQQGS